MPFLRKKRIAKALAERDPVRAVLNVSASQLREERLFRWLLLSAVGAVIAVLFLQQAHIHNLESVVAETKKSVHISQENSRRNECARHVTAKKDLVFSAYLQAISNRDLASYAPLANQYADLAESLKDCDAL